MTERSDYIRDNRLMQKQYFSEKQLKPTYLHLYYSGKVVKLVTPGLLGALGLFRLFFLCLSDFLFCTDNSSLLSPLSASL